MRCFACHQEIGIGNLKIPEMRGELFIHKECLGANIQKCLEDTKKATLLEAIAEFEESHPREKYGWYPEQVSARKEELTPLVKLGILGRPLHTNRYVSYKLTSLELTRKALKGVAEASEEREIGEISLEIFTPVVGFDDLKERLVKAVNNVIVGKPPVHFLFEGVPATGKTTICECLSKALGAKMYRAVGSRTSSAGIVEAMTLYRPLVFFLDEIDQVPQDALSSLLSLMETGKLVETKHRKVGLEIELNTLVIGACNSSKNLPQALLSRFLPYHIYFPPYSRDEFVQVCEGFLEYFEQIPRELGRYVGERVYEMYGTNADVRIARGLVRMGRTKEEVEQELAFLQENLRKKQGFLV